MSLLAPFLPPSLRFHPIPKELPADRRFEAALLITDGTLRLEEADGVRAKVPPS